MTDILQSLSLPQELDQEIRTVAFQEGVTKHEVILRLLRSGIEQHKNPRGVFTEGQLRVLDALYATLHDLWPGVAREIRDLDRSYRRDPTEERWHAVLDGLLMLSCGADARTNSDLVDVPSLLDSARTVLRGGDGFDFWSRILRLNGLV